MIKIPKKRLRAPPTPRSPSARPAAAELPVPRAERQEEAATTADAAETPADAEEPPPHKIARLANGVSAVISAVERKTSGHKSCSASESFAREAVQSQDFSVSAVKRALSLASVSWNTTRTNVIPEGQSGIYGMLLGLYAFGDVGCSSGTARHPWLTQLLVEFLHANKPGFPCTSIQVNKNYASRPHVDRNNLGSSMIIAVGDFHGGQLWTEGGEGEADVTLTENIKSPYCYRAGMTYKGSLVDVRDRLVEFDGNRLHCTTPFKGERYSLVYFVCDRYADASPEVRDAMQSVGFRFSWSEVSLQVLAQAKMDTKRELRLRAIAEWQEEKRAEREALGRCFARTWNRGWGGACPHWRASENPFFCRTHGDKRETWKTHGRIDGLIPQAKKEEMLKWQKIMTSKGEKPPDPLPHGSCVMVALPGWVRQPLLNIHGSRQPLLDGFEGYLPPDVVGEEASHSS